MVKFLRRDWSVFSRLGRKRKNKQTWRNPTGRHNKIREKIAGHPAIVSIGYGTEKVGRGKVKEKTPIKISNIKDLEKVGKENIAILLKVGTKKKIEIATKAQEKKIEIANLNIKKFLAKNKIKENKK
jgi:large subunit ribosomal protein L32e